jgi:hypothetical protein
MQTPNTPLLTLAMPMRGEYTFAVMYDLDALEISIMADSPTWALRDAQRLSMPGWSEILLTSTPLGPVAAMFTPAALERRLLVAAAAQRLFAQTHDGEIGRLLRWDTPKRPNTTRLELRPGVAKTYKCGMIALVEAPTQQQEKPQ